jgi:hypothetical protein
VDSLISKHYKSLLQDFWTKTRPNFAKNYGTSVSAPKAILRACPKSYSKQKSWNYYKRRLTQKRQPNKHVYAKSRIQHGIGRSIPSDNGRGLNADEVEEVVAGVVGLLNHAVLEIQDRLHRTDEAHQTEVHHRGGKLTPTYHQVGTVGGQLKETGLLQDHQRGQLLVHLPVLLL